MSKASTVQKDEPVVYLGYIEDGDKVHSELLDQTAETKQPSSSSKNLNDDSSICPWLVNKIGGTPIFPYNESTLEELKTTLELIRCKNCKSTCVLILQIMSPIDDSPLDRVIQLYTCVKNDCIKHSWFAMRCMLKSEQDSSESKSLLHIPEQLMLVQDPVFGPVLVCQEKSFFEPYYLSVMNEPTGRENFAKNNLEALKLASKFNDPDLKPAPIEEKYKNLKNYKPPKPHASMSDLDDFEKFQMEKLYGNDKDMYRFYKRVGRYQAQVCRYDWEGEPLINSNKVKLDIRNCTSCSNKRKFELQLMSALINYLKTDREFDRESQDFSSILVHSCSKNCSTKSFNLEDTFFMPDPDSRIFNKLKQRMLAVKLGDSIQGGGNMDDIERQVGELINQQPHPTSHQHNSGPTQPSTNKKKNKKKKNKK